MVQEGQYIYGIISTSQRREFGPIGIGAKGDVVYTIPYRDLAAISSNTPIIKYAVTRDNSLAHARVLEKVMEEYTILPVRFCTIADSEETIIEKLLKPRYQEFVDLLQNMEGKIELGVRVRWTDLNTAFAEVVEENEEIKGIKESIMKEKHEQKKYASMIKVGQMVQKSLEEKKKREAQELLELLKPLSLDCKECQIYGDMNIINAAFLVSKECEGMFDQKVQEIEKVYGERKKLKYIGPVVPYNFVEVVVQW